MRDDEIQVLGISLEEQGTVVCHKRYFLRIAIWLVSIGGFILVLVLCWIITPVLKNVYQERLLVERVKEDVDTQNPLLIQDSQIAYQYYADNVNDVPMHIYLLDNMEASLTMDSTIIDDQLHTRMMMVVLATDIREDNKKPVGDFVVNGEKIARGKSREGYCAIVHGRISIGRSENDDVMNYCIQEGGSFFREYPLVINGEICKNKIRGKRIRRALVQQEGNIYVIESENKESIYDFSEAIRDLGAKDAIYLPAGINYMLVKTDSLHQENNMPEYGGNFLVFKSRK
jgi:uncharacterized protein YigE (DUF2233 family)